MIEENQILEVPEELLAHIKDLEGLELKAYEDVNGVLTIGYGHTNATGTFEFDKDTEISENKALAILIADLNKGLFHVNNMLNNRGLTVNDVVKEYMVLVYLNRPWALAKTMEDIATMNADIAKQSQLDIYKEENGTDAPDWYVNRINKEFAYLNEFDDKSTGNDTWYRYRYLDGQLLRYDAAADVWLKALQRMNNKNSKPVTPGYNPAKPVEKKGLLSKVSDVINNAIDEQLNFMDRVYGRK